MVLYNDNKLLEKIQSCIKKIKTAIKQDNEFEQLHEDSLNISEITFSKKLDYKSIDIMYPSYVVVNLKMYNGDPDQRIEVPSAEDRRAARLALAKSVIDVLAKAERKVKLRLSCK